MAARAIIGIALGIIFAPVLWLLMISFQPIISPADTTFSSWLLSITTDFTSFGMGWLIAGPAAMNLEFIILFTPVFTIGNWFSWFGAAIITWVILGMWAGAIERSPGRGIGVAAGIWLGWLIIELILLLTGLMYPLDISYILIAIMAQWGSLVVIIVVAVIFGAMTKSEEF